MQVKVDRRRLEGRTVYIRPLDTSDAPELHRLRVTNRNFLAGFEPSRHDRFFHIEVQLSHIEAASEDWANDDGYAFGIFDRETDEMIGRVALSNVVRGAWQNATLGYFVAEVENGKGIATEAVGLTLEFAFKYASLHRVQAGVMVRNGASARVLLKNGFRHEGRSDRYLEIAGKWEDHDMYAITSEEWPGALRE
jgi:ribosomal-protein-alanine N-acetyltransferase